ncbi:hypothetical protein PINS_up016661 [Pythium insidiosum]|nr:hypothetical protein PINS_up016661 [Pythium insidiosum]
MRYRRAASASTSKSLEGSLGCLVMCSVVSVLVITRDSGTSEFERFVRAWSAGLCASVAERIHVGVDDNLSMPLLSACLMYAVEYALPSVTPMTLHW